MVGRGRWGSNPIPTEYSMFSTTCNERARTPFIHSKRLGPTQARDCRRVSPRKTNKSLQHKKMLELGRGVQTYEPRYFNGLPGTALWWHLRTPRYGWR